ncbi:MAG: 2-amino-4-hydroxy-6-hydroxymethyldihydropteridine diphosphokinase [Flavobacteriales bacterium]|nr:2-amino-4-hydroxy-6-hydroxymethyldihydropteridine diphosphokinase [Flavobacteriales bacterium]
MEQKVKLHQVVIALGTNLGDKESNLSNAINQIKTKVGEVQKVSSIYKNSALGFESENEFFNACLICETKLNPFELLAQLKLIEREMGRTKTRDGYEDRIIDLDIIFFDDLIIATENLVIPHPAYKNRAFVLVPLNEIL